MKLMGDPDWTFEKFIATSTIQQIALKTAKAFAEVDDPLWIIFMGLNGTGKTHLAVAIIKALQARGIQPIAERTSAILRRIYATMKPDSIATESDVIADYCLSDVLLMDEYGKQSSTPASVERIEEILDERYVRRKRTIITTNLSKPEIDMLSPAMLSRMSDVRMSVIVTLTGNDFRKERTDD